MLLPPAVGPFVGMGHEMDPDSCDARHPANTAPRSAGPAGAADCALLFTCLCWLR